jgi:hypothetical protein
MRKLFSLIILSICFTANYHAQPKAKPTPPRRPSAEVKPKPAIDFGELQDRSYTNFFFGFKLTFPSEWFVNTVENDKDLKKVKLNFDTETPKNTKTILTAFKFQEKLGVNSVLRIAVEDLENFPAIKDAVDYLDAMRQTFKAKKLPADFKYSETNAEKLGYMQFAYLDVSNNKGKKRLYATVRNGFAIIFTLTHKNDEDLKEMKQIITDGDFSLQNIDFKAQ